MTEGRIYVNVKVYRGKDERKLQAYRADVQAAAVLEEYLNKRRIVGQPQTQTYFDIARDLGMDKETVERILIHVRGGHNGITY